ncbi:predicted protein [Chaetomium globosum CBS 148.51]|uniref:Uncharacterized protein n=1 Tax=Chaetomium globosum (strain ATCC 6205 / CBS 148.51 / DSM 1962 / NBRC 6347 / NRRL 1970) TaxID=306901 RepID=Q2H418_CHAGB|nr:uncharacterized protein CHGG_06597 [Chaetomium globosum CBS 148.51]EAQ89978.1 predicted protein [Chaetomium globosum CBS 148.51]
MGQSRYGSVSKTLGQNPANLLTAAASTGASIDGYSRSSPVSIIPVFSLRLA